jgi:sialic acid synthase SpsE
MNTKATPVDEFWKPLKEHCDKKRIVFFSTPMSRGAAQRLSRVGVPLWKIGSGDILDLVMLDYLRNTEQPVIMSSGASSFEEVEKSFNFLRAKNKRCALMHALSKYPGEPEEANLAIMELYKERFPGVPIGFSENSIGIEPSLISVALGATIVEKHFTTDRDLWGADHKVCSTPIEFKEMVDGIRAIENNPKEKEKWLGHAKFAAIVGKKEKILRDDEAVFRPVFQKTLVAGKDIPAGTVVTAEMVYAMRPRAQLAGLPSEQYESVIGKKTKRDIKKHDPITDSTLV